MTDPSTTIDAPAHIKDLLSELHRESLEQEASISKKGKVFSTDVINDLKDKASGNDARSPFDELMVPSLEKRSSPKMRSRHLLTLPSS